MDGMYICIRNHKNNCSMKIFVKILFVVLLVSCLVFPVSSPLALVTGFVFAHFLGNPFSEYTHKFTSLLLKVSVVGLGFGMNVHSALSAGKDGFWITITSIALVLILGYFLGKALGMPRKLSHLVSSGTAICGGSAIAAVAPAVKADENEMSMSLAVVFLLNAIALIIFPVLGHIIGMDQHDFGTWCAIAIHDTSSVVGAASAYGEEALMVATTVKLARALWIIPISILSAFMFRSGSSRISIPWFIFFFIAAMLLNSYLPLGKASVYMFDISKKLLVATLFLIGSNLSIAKMKVVGVKPLIFGIILWFVVGIYSLAIITLI